MDTSTLISAISQAGWLKFTLPIAPEAHADATMFGRGHAYTPKEKRDFMYNCAIRFSWLKDNHKAISFPLKGPCVAVWFFITERPKNKRNLETMDYYIPMGGRADTDGFLKCVKDTLQLPKKPRDYTRRSGIIVNDSQIFSEHVIKMHTKNNEPPSIHLWIKEYHSKTYIPFTELFS